MPGLYMFAIVPPPELEERIQKERIIFSENYNCIKALKPPVHITVYDPFQQDEDFEQLVDGLHAWAARQQPFLVEVDNYGFFENPKSPVAFINVIKSSNITTLRTSLLLELKKYVEEPETELLPNNRPIPRNKPKPFNPHFTIGYRDVAPELLGTIKHDYAKRKFKGSFTCDTICLWKHNGQNWQTIKKFILSGRSTMAAQPTLF